MSLINIPYTFSAGAVIIASQHNTNFSTIYSDYNGNIDNTNIVSGAGIVYSKLNLTGGITNSDINSSAGIVGSKIDFTTASAIGTVSPAAGKFTTLEATSTLKLGTTHQGDVLYDNGTSLVRLTPGTSGQALITQGAGANPIWGNAGSVVFTSSTSFSSATSSGSISITSTKYYLLKVIITSISAANWISFRFNGDTGSNYKYVSRGFDFAANANNINNNAGTTFMRISNSFNPSTVTPIVIDAYIFPQGTTGTLTSLIYGKICGPELNTVTFGYMDFMGAWNGTATATSIAVLSDGTSTITGTAYLYEIKTS